MGSAMDKSTIAGRLPVLCVAILLGGCGIADVKIEAAGSFAASSQQAVAQTRQFYQGMVDADRQFQSLRWTLDPQCPLLEPGEDRDAPGFDDPTALPLVIEAMPDRRGGSHASGGIPPACDTYADETCRRTASGKLNCHPVLGTVVANGFFCPSAAARQCVKSLTADDLRRVSFYTHTLISQQSFLSRTTADFKADLRGVETLTDYLDSLAKLATVPTANVGAAIKSYADDFETLHDIVNASQGVTGNSPTVSALGSMISPLASLADQVQGAVARTHAVSTITDKLRDGMLRDSLNTAILRLAKAADANFCSVYSNSALQNEGFAETYLGFGFGPNDLASRRSLVNNLLAYRATLKTTVAQCARKANGKVAAGSDADYTAISPTGTVLLQIRKANNELLQTVANDRLTPAQRTEAVNRTLVSFKSALQSLTAILLAAAAL